MSFSLLDSRHSTLVTRLMREPLVHFLLIGAALFLIFSFLNDPVSENQKRIAVTPGQVEQLAANFSRTWMRPPTKDELAGLESEWLEAHAALEQAESEL